MSPDERCACCDGPLGGRPQQEDPASDAPPPDRDLLQQAADALWKCAKAALTVKPALDQPYPDAPEWTPYTRWVERPAREAHDLAMQIRRHLREGTPS